MFGELFFINKWVFFESYVKLIIKTKLLAYNTYTGDVFECEDNKIVSYFAQVTKNATNTLFIISKDSFIEHPNLLDYLNILFTRHFIEIIPITNINTKPFIFMPKKKINKDIFKKNNKMYVGDHCITYLKRLTINIVRIKPLIKKAYTLARRQHLFYDSFGKPKAKLDVQAFEYFCSSLNNAHIEEITAIIHPIKGHSEIKKIMNIIIQTAINKHIIVEYNDAAINGKLIKELIRDSSAKISVIINDNHSKKCTINQIHRIQDVFENNFTTIFLLSNEKELEHAEDISTEINDLKVSCCPIFTGTNLDFFNKFVFLKKCDVFSKPHSYSDIFCNETLNKNFFGCLYINAEGRCYGDLSNKYIDDIDHHTAGEIIYKELTKRSSWKRTRNKVKPCSNCIYNCFCPPISHYELVIGRNNLCNL